jgi:4-amino-4-deoxy-L-arabinose transferase-like glycosyltransferase
MDADQERGKERESASTIEASLPAAVLLLLFAASMLFFLGLDAPLLEPQEARYAEIPRQMLAQGRLVVPTLHGEAYLDKPPLLYWAVMASYRLFGIHDWSARLVPGLAGVLTVLCTYLWGRRFLGPQAGLCAAVILCLMPEFVYRGRMLTFDTLLALWVTAALASAHVGLSDASLRWRWWLLSALACGLGLLTKGPVALALVAGPVLAMRLVDRRLARPGVGGWTVYLALTAAIAAPWYLAVMQAMPDFAGYFFWKHNVVRFLTPFDHARPVWYYLPGLLAGLLPWTLLVPGLLMLLLLRSPRSMHRRPPALAFMLIAFAWMLLFFSAAGCKRPTYLLPALPPMALALGWYAHLRAPSWRELYRRGSRLATAAAVLALLAGLLMSLTAAYLHFTTPQGGLVLAGTMLTGLAALTLSPRRLSWAGSAAVVFAVGLLAVKYLLPAYNRQFALRTQLLAAGSQERVVCYPQRFDSVSFYLRENQVHAFALDQRRELITYLQVHPGTMVIVKSGPILQELLRELPPGIVFSTRQRGVAMTVGRIIHRDRMPAMTLAQR